MPKQRDRFEDELAVHVGRNVKRLREERGIKPHEMAKVLNCSIRTLQAYEAGNRRISLADAVRISVALAVDIDSLTLHVGKLAKALPQIDFSAFKSKV